MLDSRPVAVRVLQVTIGHDELPRSKTFFRGAVHQPSPKTCPTRIRNFNTTIAMVVNVECRQVNIALYAIKMSILRKRNSVCHSVADGYSN